LTRNNLSVFSIFEVLDEKLNPIGVNSVSTITNNGK
jgi:hypothetical protein